MRQDKILTAISRQSSLMSGLFQQQLDDLDRLADLVVQAFNKGRKLIFVGNGQLAPIAHLAASLFFYRLRLERPALPAVALGQDPSLTLSLARDGVVQEVYSRQFQVVAETGDILILLADGQHDPAFDQLLERAKDKECLSGALAPDRSEGSLLADLVFFIHAEAPAETAQAALFFGQLLCEMVENDLFGI
jgi:D-sedoheptulose 7-phosphate isomerase